MSYRFEKRLIISAFVVITLLLSLNIIFTYINSRNIEKNMDLQQKSEQTKTAVSHIAIHVIHNLDLGIRSYALFKEEKYLYPYRIALEKKDSILHVVENLLPKENYSHDELQALKDSINAYANLNIRLKALVNAHDDARFMYYANQDRGYLLWLQYEQFANHVNSFEDKILAQAKKNYRSALRNNYLLQFLLFVICIPTLLFTTIHTFKTFRLEKKLRESEKKRAEFLKNQNETLERMVVERTDEIQKKNNELQQQHEEIAAQNEEIKAQNEQLVNQQEEILAQRDLLSLQNQKLSDAQEVILTQQREIQLKNESLEIEVERKTKELVAYNQQLEQFAFASAHNLRAPVARILGLGNVLDYGPHDSKEERLIIKNIIKSTTDLDTVIKDLTSILDIKTNIHSCLSEVNFSEEMKIIKANLAREIWETKCEITEFFEEAPTVISVKGYIDSILFNLVSNAIKYRSPERTPAVIVRTSLKDNFLCLEVKDNGLGIDLEKYGKDIFSLYKRFHTHTEGKGLGLHLVKMQALALGGNVCVTSVPGEGSVFIVHLKINGKGVNQELKADTEKKL